jgi:hemoglobin
VSHDDEPDRIFPARARQPLHASITEAHIAMLVDIFYRAIWADPRLGPIFSAHVTDRPKHLDTMRRFWSSVLLKTAAYKGRPVPAHMKLTEVTEMDFPRWLALFRTAAHDTFEPDAAVLVIEAAERIAQSLWFAMFEVPGAVPRQAP